MTATVDHWSNQWSTVAVMRVLIVGAGIGGTTSAYWLARAGHQITLVERAPQPRQGGYLIDFWGAGFEVAERMGIVPRLLEDGYRIRELREVDDRGRRVTHVDLRRLAAGAGGRYVSVARADLARAIQEVVPPTVETVFGDTVASIVDEGDRVRVGFATGTARDFDLVLGADGLHSRVRALTFGPESEFERYLGIAVAAFDLDGYRPRDELIAVSHTRVGVQMLRLALHDGATMFLFTFRHDGAIPEGVPAQQEMLRRRLREVGGEVPGILARMSEARTFYLDRVSQIRMTSWTRGRVALVGDAAACPSLLAGQGSALAMVEAYVLAGELGRGDHASAFAAYERRLASIVRGKQDAALGLAGAFAPRNRTQLLLRNLVLRLMRYPLVADIAAGRSLRDPIELSPGG